ncbi:MULTISPECIES: hypothetical protein [unclassified Neptuniibacter]|jgi:hypothetical protein|uniref:hypothetical protein n=1 Tax=unclassified Neptuniibacter TaxID=2630693 RepID=UPI0025FC4691|nr:MULTISPECIES: hypothetical protein [unclassified Neptuniibacter]|tara:strand:+ start:868 stop:1143 length:276 start_codon:yes stop_codon:yes gene_type:complete
MLTYEECLELSELTSDEVDAIAEHEHMDPMMAMALGHYMITHAGEQKIKRIIMDDIEKAQRDHNYQHAEMLQKVLKHFIATHPEHNSMKAA